MFFRECASYTEASLYGYDCSRFIPEEDSEVHREAYNAELKGLESEGKNTWFKAPWLFAEFA